MSLRKKIILILLVVAVLYGAVSYLVQKTILLPSFVKLENQQAVCNLERCERALQREIEHLEQFCVDWSAWDDTRLFIQGKKDDYAEQNLTDDTFLNQKLNVFCFLDNRNQLVWGKCVKLSQDEQLIDLPIKEFTAEALPKQKFLLSHKKPEDYTAGLMMTQAGPMLVASRPITNNENTLPISGTLIVGRLVNDETMAMLSEQTQVTFEWWNLSSIESRQALEPYIRHLSLVNSFFLENIPNQKTVAVYKIVPGLNTRQAVLIKAITPKEITRQGYIAIQFALVSLLVGGCVVLLVLLVLLEKMVLNPIHRLEQYACRAAEGGELDDRIRFEGENEITSLAGSFNRMITQFYQLRAEQTESGYQIRMAEFMHRFRERLRLLRKQVETIRCQINNASMENLQKNWGEPGDTDSKTRKEELVRMMDVARKSAAEATEQLFCDFQNVEILLNQWEQQLSSETKKVVSVTP